MNAQRQHGVAREHAILGAMFGANFDAEYRELRVEKIRSAQRRLAAVAPVEVLAHLCERVGRVRGEPGGLDAVDDLRGVKPRRVAADQHGETMGWHFGS